jgi:3-mercaptopyruvate sulfurtransferase SseA
MNTSQKKKTFFVLLIGVALIVAILAACAPSTPQAEPTSPAVEAPGEVQRLSLEESKAAFDSGAAVFLDVRSQSSYAASHIPGALSIPLIELEPRIDELDPDQWIITYCT